MSAWWRRVGVVRAAVMLGAAAWVVTSEQSSWVGMAIGLMVAAALLVGNRAPLVALIVAFLGLFAAGSAPGHGPDDPFLFMLVIACFHVGRYAGMTRQPWAAAGVLALLSTNLLEANRDVSVADAAFPVLFTGGPWLLGLAVQLADRRADRAVDYARSVDALRTEETRRALAEERLRIAHDLHDVVAHSITALSLQAQVARRNAAAGRPVDETTLRAIEQTAHAAMDDVRRLLGVLRPDGELDQGGPTWENLPGLLDSCRAVGQEVVLSVRGEARPLAPALGATAYRIVQEALTNARRHGGPGGTRLLLDWRPTELRVRVTNPTAAPSAEDPGHGVLGMEERARMFGGSAVSRPEGDLWIVDAVLPLPALVSEMSS